MGGRERFLAFTNAVNDDICLEIDDKHRLSDAELLEALATLLGDKLGTPLLKLGVAERTNILRELKALEGANNSQIARLSGVSKSTVQRA